MKVIAEIGSNWTTLDEQVASVEKAKLAGADAVKFQLFNEKELYGPSMKVERRSAPRLEDLANVCDKLHIDFMCSAFSAKGVAKVDKYVDVHKIASAEMCDLDIVNAVIETGKPFIVSTGGHTFTEVEHLMDAYLPGTHASFAYCESAYPATCTIPERYVALQDAAAQRGFECGFSDHSKEIYTTPWVAKVLRSPFIEKHVNLVNVRGPDAAHSLNFEEFSAMCRYIRSKDKLQVSLLDAAETDMYLQHNRRIVATCDIPEGTSMVKGVNFGFYRGTYENAHFLSPFDWEQVNGKIASRDISALEAISEGDYE
jgi:sialic acid synthase SpsE